MSIKLLFVCYWHDIYFLNKSHNNAEQWCRHNDSYASGEDPHKYLKKDNICGRKIDHFLLNKRRYELTFDILYDYVEYHNSQCKSWRNGQRNENCRSHGNQWTKVWYEVESTSNKRKEKCIWNAHDAQSNACCYCYDDHGNKLTEDPLSQCFIEVFHSFLCFFSFAYGEKLDDAFLIEGWGGSKVNRYDNDDVEIAERAKCRCEKCSDCSKDWLAIAFSLALKLLSLLHEPSSCRTLS